MKSTIGKKLALGLGAMLILVLIMGIVFQWSTTKVQKSVARYQELRDLNELMTLRLLEHFKWMQGLSAGVFIQGKKFEGKLNHEECDLGKWMASYKPYSDEMEAPFKALYEPHKNLHASAEKILAAYREGDLLTAHNIFSDETVPSATMVHENLTKMKEILTKDEETAKNNLILAQKKARIITFGLTASIIFLGIAGGIVFVRGITSPINKVMNVMQRVSKGDLMERVSGIKGNDEVAQMALYMNKMIDSLTNIISQIKSNANQLVVASSQIASSADQTSKNSESSAAAVEEMTSTMHEMSTNIQNIAKNLQKQASSVTETSASVEQMVTSIRRVAEHVKKLVELSENSKNAVSTGSVSVNKASMSMAEINTVIQQSAQTITSLGSKTEEMAKIVEVIDDIAEQTNLLALNAAIEAARAGEQGMGFAVVAEEVRKLAERSAKSTREIADLINSIAKEAHSAVENMTKSTQIVEQGLLLNHEVIQALEGIKSSVAEVSRYSNEIGAATQEQSSGSEQIGKEMINLNEVIQEVNTASEEQSVGAEQVVQTIEKIREMIQQDASNSLELASAAEQLRRQAGGLLELVDIFSVNGDAAKK